MPQQGYYAYIFGDDGHIRNRVDIICDDDAEARRCAKHLVDGRSIELWQEARLVETFEPKQ